MFYANNSALEETELLPAPTPTPRSLAAKKSGPGSSWQSRLYCGVINCSNCTISCPDMWFFKLPHYSEPRRQLWLKQIGQSPIMSHLRLVVCEKHFAPSDIYGSGKYLTIYKKHLRKGAIPTLFLPLNNGSQVRKKPKHVYQRANNTENKGPTTTQITNFKQTEITEENKNKEDNKKEENKYKEDKKKKDKNKLSQKSRNNKLDSDLKNKILDDFNTLHHNFSFLTESDDNIHSDMFKSKIFQLYSGDRQVYEVLQSVLSLPPVSSLPNFIPSTSADITKIYMKELKDEIIHKSFSEKYGLLCINLMRIKPHVEYDYKSDTLSGVEGYTVSPYQYALVAIVRGLNTQWHHIAAVTLVGHNMFAEFNIWLDKLVKTIIEIGIYIKAVVTSTDDFFINAFEFREEYKNKRILIINKKNIYHIYDPLHMIMLLYEELKKHNISFTKVQYGSKKVIAKWSHIFKFYKCDKTRKFRLTDRSAFIKKNDLRQNKLKSAAQILSLRTAAGMSTYVDLKILDKLTMGTVDFIVRINRILAALYPDSFKPENKKILAQTGDFWQNNIAFLNSIKCTPIKVPEVKSEVKFINCFSVSIESVIQLQEEPSMKEFASNLTQYLNQDPLGEFIDEISLKSVESKYPTPNEFFNIIKENIIQNCHMTKQKNDIEHRIKTFVKNALIIIEQNHSKEVESNNACKRSFENFSDDYTELDDEDANSIFYIATYLLEKMYQKYKSAVSMRMRFMNSNICYENRKKNFSGSIIIPDDDFLQFVYNMDSVFVNGCKKAIGTGKMFEGMVKEINKFIVPGPIGIGLDYIISLFVDLRIYHTVKLNNALYEKDVTKPHQFVASRLNSLGVNLENAKFTLPLM